MVLTALIVLVAAYLLGSIPTGYLVGRAKGIDLRSVGSGNIGATNALRILGKPAGIFVLVVDALKGWAACVLVPMAAWRLGAMPESPAPPLSAPIWLPVLGGLAVVLGHNYTCWLRFKGGKGIATSAGVLAGLLPTAFAAVLVTFAVMMLVTRIVSLSSLVAAAVLPLATWFGHGEPLLIAFSAALTLLAFYRHRANIRRLLDGTEPRIGQRPPSHPPADRAAS